MIREMLRISLLLAGATVGLAVGPPPVHAQTAPKPAARPNVPLMVPNYGPPTSPTTSTYQRLDAAQNAQRAQSCAAMSGAAADRCNADLRAKITADDLRQRSIDSSQPQDQRQDR